MRIMKFLIWISFFLNFVPNLYGRTVFVQNRIENENVELKWIQTSDGIQLQFFGRTDHRNVFSGSQPFFEMHADSSNSTIDARSGWSEVRATLDSKERVTFDFIKNEDDQLKVHISVRASLEGKLVLFTPLKWVCDGCSAKDRQFPKFNLWRPDGGSWHYPSLSGVSEPVPEVSSHVVKVFSYPSFFASYQMWGLVSKSSSFYLAHHESKGAGKTTVLDKLPGADHIVFKTYWGGSSLPIGDFAVGAVQGDWYDHAKEYKNWLKTTSPVWKMNQSSNSSIENINYWVVEGCAKIRDCVDLLKKVRSKISGRIGFHWYGWHQIPFDTNYPRYFPEKAGFKEAVKELQDMNIAVMPYINGQLWDHNVAPEYPGCFENSIYSSKDEVSKFSINQRPYSSGCPTTRWWQNTIHTLVDRLVNEYKVDGVYFDSVAAGYGTCMAEHHSHQPGWGPDFYSQGYMKILNDLKLKYGAKIFFTSEGAAEPYIGWFDGFLTWNFGMHDKFKPIFHTIYGSYTSLFGRFHDNRSLTIPGGFKALQMKTAQALVFGEEIGWHYVKEFTDREFELIANVLKIRNDYRSYFSHGQLERSPTILDDVGKVTSNFWTMYQDNIVTYSS
ncbi:MAG: DUF6259 domain-containing protein, partial [Proteobacteria bacterium]|nr:DUF6259 domain-containing protein [Pseudomonadota bacterium]